MNIAQIAALTPGSKIIALLCVCLLVLISSGSSANVGIVSVTSERIDRASTGNTNSNQNRGTVAPKSEQIESVSTGIEKFIGCWTGEKGGGLRIDSNSITWFDQSLGHTHKYELVTQNKEPSDTENSVLIKVRNTKAVEFLRLYMLFKLGTFDPTTKQQTAVVFGFDTYNDVQPKQFASAGRFYPAKCSELE